MEKLSSLRSASMVGTIGNSAAAGMFSPSTTARPSVLEMVATSTVTAATSKSSLSRKLLQYGQLLPPPVLQKRQLQRPRRAR